MSTETLSPYIARTNYCDANVDTKTELGTYPVNNKPIDFGELYLKRENSFFDKNAAQGALLAMERSKRLLEQQKKAEKELILLESKNDREILDEEFIISHAKDILYSGFFIDEKLENNNGMQQFVKGLIDELIIGNAELAISIINTKGKILIDGIKTLFTWEGYKKLSESLKDSFWNLFTGNAYEKGKSFAQLGLVTTGVGLAINIGKKGVKVGIKNALKDSLKLTKMVGSGDVSNQIFNVSSSVKTILNKTSLDFKKMKPIDFRLLKGEDKVLAGSYLLKRDLNEVEKQAILRLDDLSKKVGKKSTEGLDEVSSSLKKFKELKERRDLLKEAGFSLEESREILKNGLGGKVGGYDLKELSSLAKIKLNKISANIDQVLKNLNFEYIMNHPDKLQGLINLGKRLGLKSLKDGAVKISANMKLNLREINEHKKYLEQLVKELKEEIASFTPVEKTILLTTLPANHYLNNEDFNLRKSTEYSELLSLSIGNNTKLPDRGLDSLVNDLEFYAI